MWTEMSFDCSCQSYSLSLSLSSIPPSHPLSPSLPLTLSPPRPFLSLSLVLPLTFSIPLPPLTCSLSSKHSVPYWLNKVWAKVWKFKTSSSPFTSPVFFSSTDKYHTKVCVEWSQGHLWKNCASFNKWLCVIYLIRTLQCFSLALGN